LYEIEAIVIVEVSPFVPLVQRLELMYPPAPPAPTFTLIELPDETGKGALVIST
jgi:hypothetical protein